MSRSRRCAGLGIGWLAAQAFILSGTALAGSPELGELPPDTRVRITAPSLDLDRAEGSMVRSEADSLLVQLKSSRESLWIPMGALTSVDVRRKDSARRRNGTLIGVLAGGVAGGVLGHNLASDRPNDSWSFSLSMSKGVGATFGVLAGIVVGGAIGTLVGSAVAEEYWDPVRLGPRNLGIGIRPTAEQPVMTLSVRIPLGGG